MSGTIFKWDFVVTFIVSYRSLYDHQYGYWEDEQGYGKLVEESKPGKNVDCSEARSIFQIVIHCKRDNCHDNCRHLRCKC